MFLATDTAKLMKEVGLTPPTATSKTFVGHGQDLRSGQARGIHQELHDQEGCVDDAAVGAVGDIDTRAPHSPPSLAGGVDAEGVGGGLLLRGPHPDRSPDGFASLAGDGRSTP